MASVLFYLQSRLLLILKKTLVFHDFRVPIQESAFGGSAVVGKAHTYKSSFHQPWQTHTRITGAFYDFVLIIYIGLLDIKQVNLISICIPRGVLSGPMDS